MKSYIQKLRLRHDPFEDEFRRDDFFGGGSREKLAREVLDKERGQVSLDVFIGPRGSGKTRLAFRMVELARGDFRPASVSVDLFTTAQVLLRDILLELELESAGDIGRDLDSLGEFAIDLVRSGKSILLIIDDAHELGPDCMKLVERLLAKRWSAIHPVLLGEEQLREMLQTRLRERYRAGLELRELPAFNRAEIAEYIHLKLERAGYEEKLSLSSLAGLDLLRQSAGLPGKINVLTAALLNSDEVPAVGRIFERPRESRPRAEQRPEFRYLRQAFVLSLALGAVALWPADESGPSETSAADRDEPRRISLPAPISPASDSVAQNLAPAPSPAAGAMAASPPATPMSDSEAPGLSEFELMLLGLPPGNFTVQVLGSTSEEGVREFIAASRLGEIHGYYETRRRRQPWFVVVDGIYPDWEAAMEARARLTGEFGDLEPWVRRMSNVHSEIGLAGKQGGAGP